MYLGKRIISALAAAAVALGIVAGLAGSSGGLLADGPAGEEPQIRPGVANVIVDPPVTYPPGLAQGDTTTEPPGDGTPKGSVAPLGGPLLAGFNSVRVGTEGAY